MLACPISESFGRKPLYLGSMFLFSGFCVLTGAVPSVAGVIVGRTLSGFVSAIPAAVAPGSIEDSESHLDLILIREMRKNAIYIGYSTYLR